MADPQTAQVYPPNTNPPYVPPPASKPVDTKPAKPVKAPLSIGMKPDDYCTRLTEDREAVFVAQDKAMKERHTEEQATLKKEQDSEVAELAARRENSKKEVEAVKKHVEMWQRHADERRHAKDPGALIRTQDAERVMLARETGYEVRHPTVGDTTISGFPTPMGVGQPWIRAVNVPLANRIHPEI
jgi:hypothetical protein